MKSPFLRWAGIFSLLAVSGYVALSALPLFFGRPETALLYTRRIWDTAAVYGVFLRQELVLPQNADCAAFSEGEKLPAGKCAPKGGIFTRSIDGFEHLELAELSTEGIKNLCLDRRAASLSPGKLITGWEYEFLAIAEAEKAQTLQPGDTAVLETEHFGGIELILEEKGSAAGDFIPLRFRGSRDMDTVMYLRQLQGQLRFGSHTGLCAPNEAIKQDENGYFVRLLSLGREEKVPVTVIYEGEGFKLIQSPLLCDGSELIIKDPEVSLP